MQMNCCFGISNFFSIMLEYKKKITGKCDQNHITNYLDNIEFF